MFVVSCVGRIASDPVDEGKQRSCRLAVALDKNQIVKLITWSKEAPLVPDTMVFVFGMASKIEGNHLQIEASIVYPVDQLSPVAAVVSGVTKFTEQRFDQNQRPYYGFQVGSYDGRDKTYTNASVTSSHPLCKFSEGKRVAIAGTINTNTYTSSKSGEEQHAINMRGRDMEITERKDGTSSSNHAASKSTMFDAGAGTGSGNIPF